MKDFQKRFLLALTLIPAIDFPWIYLNYRFGLYKHKIDQKNKIIVILAYLIFIITIALFLSAFIHVGPEEASYFGFIIGFICYITFNTTAVSIFKKWDPYTALIDTIYGAFLFTMVSVIIHLAFPGPLTEHTRVSFE